MFQSRFTDNLLYMVLKGHSNKNSAAINNRYLDFVQMRVLFSLANDNRVDSNLKEILVYLYLGSVVNSRP